MASVSYRTYRDEGDFKSIQELCTLYLSEPYNRWVFRFFIEEHPELTVLAFLDNECIGVVLSKIDVNGEGIKHGYIGMVAVKEEYRCQGIAAQLVSRVVARFRELKIPFIDLETEVNNFKAITFYQKLGFYNIQELPRNYVVNSSAYRMRMFL